jgi:hypothetical protein
MINVHLQLTNARRGNKFAEFTSDEETDRQNELKCLICSVSF